MGKERGKVMMETESTLREKGWNRVQAVTKKEAIENSLGESGGTWGAVCEKGGGHEEKAVCEKRGGHVEQWYCYTWTVHANRAILCPLLTLCHNIKPAILQLCSLVPFFTQNKYCYVCCTLSCNLFTCSICDSNTVLWGGYKQAS